MSCSKPILSCWAAALFFLYIIFQMTVFNTSSTYLLDDSGLSQIALGNISALYFYCAALFLIPYGLWLDYYPTRLPSLLLMSLCVMSILLLVPLPSLYTAGLYRAVCGLTNPLIFLVWMRQALTWFPDKTSLAISLIITVGMLGGILQYPFTNAIQQVGWHKALLLDAAFGMVLLSSGYGFLSDNVKTYLMGSFMVHVRFLKAYTTNGTMQNTITPPTNRLS